MRTWNMTFPPITTNSDHKSGSLNSSATSSNACVCVTSVSSPVPLSGSGTVDVRSVAGSFASDSLERRASVECDHELSFLSTRSRTFGMRLVDAMVGRGVRGGGKLRVSHLRASYRDGRRRLFDGGSVWERVS